MTAGSPQKPDRLPAAKLLRFLFTNAAVGALVGLALAAGLVSANVSGMLDLLEASSEPVIPTILLAVGFSTLIGGVWVGAAVMLIRPND